MIFFPISDCIFIATAIVLILLGAVSIMLSESLQENKEILKRIESKLELLLND